MCFWCLETALRARLTAFYAPKTPPSAAPAVIWTGLPPRVPHRPGKWRRAVRRYYTWAELLRRVFGVEIFTCPNCGGVRRLLAAIQDPSSIERVLRAMGLPWEAPQLAVARAPPEIWG
ncbi:MAG: hypothetical protein ACI90M_002792 [Candidatus Azotimanducaceae bacterium]|jgi:hypothetical protein